MGAFLWAKPIQAQETVTEIQFEGLKRTKESFMRSMALVKPGAELDSTLLEEDVNRFKRLPSVSNASYSVSQHSKGPVVRYQITENFTLIPFANLYSSNSEEIAFRIGLQEFNFLGRNMTLGVFYQHDVYDSYGLRFKAPYLFGPKWGMEVNYTDLTTQEPVYLESGSSYYKYNNQSIEALGLFELDHRNSFALGLNVFTEKYDYQSGATDAGVPQDLDIDKYLVKLLYNYEHIRYDHQYLDGFASRLNLQYVRSQDFDQAPQFWIGFNDFIYFERWGKRGNWANRVRLGLASNVDSPFAPFTVDNNVNIRGVGNVIDRGTGSIVINTEYRHSLIEKDWFVLQSNLFMDAGSWRNPGGDFADFTDEANIRVYPGVGVRFIHKRIFNAVFRIDYGYGITKNATSGIVFGIGQYF
jgi:outer membrane protein assembly factor BamA